MKKLEHLSVSDDGNDDTTPDLDLDPIEDDVAPTEPAWKAQLATARQQASDVGAQALKMASSSPWPVLGLCGASLFLNVVLATKIAMGGAAPQVAELPVEQPSADEAVAALPSDGASDVATSAAGPADVPVAAAPAVPADLGDVHVVNAPVDGSIAHTFHVADPDHGDVLSAVYSRLFFFDLDVRSDLQKGDVIHAAYTWDGALAHIPVASYESAKLGKTLKAYEFEASGDAFPSWWDESGTEVSPRLVDGPLADYEQVTSLLKDRPRHHGMDFKVPEGTEVHAPKTGVVTKANWNVVNNGNCVEIKYPDGTLARFLHLSRTDVQAGQSIAKGQVIGLTGNTGHSTAAHLHYELEKNGTIIDPIDYHGTTRRTLAAADKPAFDAERAKLDLLLAQ